MAELIVTTTPTVEGRMATRYLGVVAGEAIMGANIFRDIFAGIRDMRSLPDVIFVIDPHREDIAVTEAAKLGIRIIGIVDTNCDPDPIQYVIPGNDDAIRSIRIILQNLVDAMVTSRKG